MGQREIMPYKTTLVRRRNGIQTAPMCRLDVESAEKGIEQPEDVHHSSRYMVGRGVKRKLSECEDPVPGLPYPQQRQLVLDLCLDKLQSCQRRAEPSLHRSVLLANTLRHIQQEMRQEGRPPLPEAPPAPSLLHAATPRHSPSLPAVPADSALSAAPSSSPPSADKEARAAEAEGRSSDSLFGAFEISNSTSYLTDLAPDDIFDDIDTSMYDSADCAVLACPASRGGAKDLLKAFSGYTASSTLQLCLMDLNDLDHIMEILVRS
ncbi:SERTA domain-containing protein 2 [Hypomesus transpacificus]|uniref:SERTA domain-containing protein 2 n=1 Tax=Hypomesus transpacificus TaxID=137520 RepID=UPI001F073627|nr:SERTA domain-containing protein 2 [Hypomesus transpacificus]